MSDPLRCLEHSDDCSGAVEYRMPLSSTGRAFPRCDHHWELRLVEQERINETYFSEPPTDEELDDERLDDYMIRAESPDPDWMNP